MARPGPFVGRDVLQHERKCDTTTTPSTTGRYHDSSRDAESSALFGHRIHPTLVSRILLALGMSPRRRKAGYEYDAAPTEDILAGELAEPSRNRVKRSQSSRVAGLVKRLVIGLPLLVLIIFGLIHVLETIIGRARLFWDVDVHEAFIPEWGMPGHAGEGLASYPTDVTQDVLPISCHSHNDYWRRVPLFDALHWGCTGVEADVWLFDEELYVGHNLASLTHNRTFRNMYVNPLVKLLDHMNPSTEFTEASGNGVFDVSPEQTLVLLVDFKTDGHVTFTAVSRQLEALREKGYLSFWDGNTVHSRAVTVVATGHAPLNMVVSNNTYRDIFFDAPLDKMWELPEIPLELVKPEAELERDHQSLNETKPSHGTIVTDAYNTSTSYYASTSFKHTVGIVWRGHLTSRQMETIRGQIRGAKRRGLKARYWDTPSWPIALRNHIWHVLMKEGADVLSVDDLRGAAVENWKRRTYDWW